MKIATVSHSQRQIILGTILGDGHLLIPKRRPSRGLPKVDLPRNARFTTSSCEKDKDYVLWKYHELESTGLFRPPKPKRRNTGRIQWILESRRSPLFTGLHKLFYPEGKKRLPIEVLNELDDLGLAVWYMDDGNLSNRTHHCLSYGRDLQHHSVTVRLSTQCFSTEGSQLIRDWLRDRFGIKARGTDLITISRREEVNKFLSIVSPHVIACMSRKKEVIQLR